MKENFFKKIEYEMVLDKMLESYKDSVSRSRNIVIILIFGSIIMFSGYWNSLEDSWFKDRVDLSRKVLTVAKERELLIREKIKSASPESRLVKKDSINTLLNVIIEKKYELLFFDSVIYKTEVGSYIKTTRSISEALIDSFLANKYNEHYTRFINQNGKNVASTYFEDRLTDMIKIRNDNALIINIPLIGLTFDVNDLGVIGGMGFFGLLCVLYYNILSEVDNLKTIFKTVKLSYRKINIPLREDEKVDRQTYVKLNMFFRYIIMQNVFNFHYEKTSIVNSVINFFAKMFYVLPCVSLYYIVKYDYESRDLWLTFEPVHVLKDSVIEFLFLALSSIFTVLCIFKSNEIDSMLSNARFYLKQLDLNIKGAEPNPDNEACSHVKPCCCPCLKLPSAHCKNDDLEKEKPSEESTL